MAEMTDIPLTTPAAEGVPPTIPALVFAAARRHAGLCALADGEVRIDYAELPERVLAVSRALIAEGIQPGDRVAVWGPNRYDWILAALGLHCAGATLVPINTRMKGNEAADILERSGTRLLFCVGQFLGIDYPAMLEPHRPASLERVVVLPCEAPSEHGDLSWQDFLAGGEAVDMDEAQARALTVRPGDLSDLLFTSGTTGKPKGVMLTHRNVMSNVKAVMSVIQPRADDVFLSFLPLSHTFERTAGYYLPMAAGACVVYARSVALLSEDLRKVRPTVLISVPRIYERVQARLQEVLATSPLKARLFAWTEAVGWRRFCRQQGLAVPASPWSVFDALAWPLLDKLAAQPLLAQFGGRLRVAVSGGAPLSPAVARCFLGVGMPLVQGYGMTETSPVVACNLPSDNDPATVGRALPGVEVRIGENRELQVRGPSVMKGYLNRPEDTAKTLSPEGWLGTGDQAAIEDGRIRILGRIKEIIVTSTGEKVPPGDLELALTGDPLFEQAFVLGEQRPFIAAVVVMNPQVWAQLAQSLQLDPKDPASLQSPAAVKAALARIQQAAASFPHYAVPRKVCLTLEPWTVENTMMTPTLKLKRNNLMSRFAAEIERLYAR